MQRRQLITLLGGPMLAHPLRAQAQAPDIMHRIGLLIAGPAVTEASRFGTPLIRGLARFGYVPGRNLTFVSRGANGQVDQLPRLVAELVASKVEVIVTFGYPPALAAKLGTTLPVVVSSGGDPVGTGLVASLARPDGHLTGISDVSAELTPKRLGVLKQLLPALRRVAVLWNADDLGMSLRYRASEAGARELGISVQPLGVRAPADFGEAFAAMTSDRPDAILMVADQLTTLNRKLVYEFAAAHRLPAMYEYDFFVRDGGLMSYGPDEGEIASRVAALVDRILNGQKPADLPFEQPTRFVLAINLETAKALGLEVPAALLARADDVIE